MSAHYSSFPDKFQSILTIIQSGKHDIVLISKFQSKLPPHRNFFANNNFIINMNDEIKLLNEKINIEYNRTVLWMWAFENKGMTCIENWKILFSGRIIIIILIKLACKHHIYDSSNIFIYFNRFMTKSSKRLCIYDKFLWFFYTFYKWIRLTVFGCCYMVPKKF